jgi:hypothetical protein
MEIIRALEEGLNDALDADLRRYRVRPERITEGAFHLTSFPGYEEYEMEHAILAKEQEEFSQRLREKHTFLKEEEEERKEEGESRPGSDGPYKTMRHWIHDKPFHQMSPYPWPWFTCSVEELMTNWTKHGEGIAFIPSGATSRTYLKAMYGAPAWTMDELRAMAAVLKKRFSIECTCFPKESHLDFSSI